MERSSKYIIRFQLVRAVVGLTTLAGRGNADSPELIDDAVDKRRNRGAVRVKLAERE